MANQNTAQYVAGKLRAEALHERLRAGLPDGYGPEGLPGGGFAVTMEDRSVLVVMPGAPLGAARLSLADAPPTLPDQPPAVLTPIRHDARSLLLVAAEGDGTVLAGWRMRAHSPGGLVQQVYETITAREVSPELVGLVPLDPAAWSLVTSPGPAGRRGIGEALAEAALFGMSLAERADAPEVCGLCGGKIRSGRCRDCDQVPAPLCTTHGRAHWDDGDPTCRWQEPPEPERYAAAGSWAAADRAAEAARTDAWAAARAKAAELLDTEDMTTAEVVAAGLELAEAFRSLNKPGTGVPA